MAVSDWSTSAALNTTVGGVAIGEGMARSDVNNAIRAVMAEAKAAFYPVVPMQAVGDGVTDNYAAWLAAYNALPATGGTIVLPPTTDNDFYFSQTLDVRKKIKLVGAGAAQGTGEQGCRFVFASGIDGIVFNSAGTTLRTTAALDANLPGAFGSVIENIMFFSPGGGTCDGVVVRCSVKMYNCAARGWTRDGWHINADIGGGGAIEGDANGWFLSNCQSILNGRHGFYVAEDDANVGLAEKCFVTLNGGWGYYDDSFIGNNWVACDSAGNVSGSIWAANATQQVNIFGFHEDDSGDTSELGVGVTSIGGNGGIPSATSTGFHASVGLAQHAPYAYRNNRGSQAVGSQLGALGTVKVAFMFGALTDEGSLSAWSMEYDATNKGWRYEYAASSSFRPIFLPNSACAAFTNKGLTGPIFQNGFGIKNVGTAEGSAKAFLLAAAAPVAGTFEVGDIVYNSAPTAGGFIGWVCTTAGSPGTFKTWGAITP